MQPFYVEPDIEDVTLRGNFPAAGEEFLGEPCDGYVYRTTFSGSNAAHTLDMIRCFLREQGYEEVPLPQTLDELMAFKLNTRNRQILMFDDNGYCHNPVKILFPSGRWNRKALILEVYNERAEQHLLRFHNKL